jgi:hypothetical protein
MAAKKRAGGSLEEQRLAAALAVHAAAAALDEKTINAAAAATTTTATTTDGASNSSSATGTTEIKQDPLFYPPADGSNWAFDGDFVGIDRIVSHRNVKPNTHACAAALPALTSSVVAYFPQFRGTTPTNGNDNKDDADAKSSKKGSKTKKEAKDEKDDDDTLSDEDTTDNETNGGTQYLVKWKNLHYDQCTWEWRSSLTKLPLNRSDNRAEIAKYLALISPDNTTPAVVLPTSSTAINSSLNTDGSFPSSVFERKAAADREEAEREAADGGDDEAAKKEPRRGPRLRTTKRKTKKEETDEALLPTKKGHELGKTGLKLRDYQVCTTSSLPPFDMF